MINFSKMNVVHFAVQVTNHTRATDSNGRFNTMKKFYPILSHLIMDLFKFKCNRIQLKLSSNPFDKLRKKIQLGKLSISTSNLMTKYVTGRRRKQIKRIARTIHIWFSLLFRVTFQHVTCVSASKTKSWRVCMSEKIRYIYWWVIYLNWMFPRVLSVI